MIYLHHLYQRELHRASKEAKCELAAIGSDWCCRRFSRSTTSLVITCSGASCKSANNCDGGPRWRSREEGREIDREKIERRERVPAANESRVMRG